MGKFGMKTLNSGAFLHMLGGIVKSKKQRHRTSTYTKWAPQFVYSTESSTQIIRIQSLAIWIRSVKISQWPELSTYLYVQRPSVDWRCSKVCRRHFNLYCLAGRPPLFLPTKAISTLFIYYRALIICFLLVPTRRLQSIYICPAPSISFGYTNAIHCACNKRSNKAYGCSNYRSATTYKL